MITTATLLTAFSGVLSVTGAPGEMPMRPGVQTADVFGALFAWLFPRANGYLLRRMGRYRDAEAVVGAQQGLDLLARCLIDPGDAVIMDRPGYLGAIQSFRAAGAKLIGWDIARADSDELEDLIVAARKLYPRWALGSFTPGSSM